jgi:hypothetical protein
MLDGRIFVVGGEAPSGVARLAAALSREELTASLAIVDACPLMIALIAKVKFLP